tara:strand:+ start:417 stop:530 length:114 start_codon:yes stop_codon:yes gene_type:complete
MLLNRLVSQIPLMIVGVLLLQSIYASNGHAPSGSLPE